MDDLDLLKRYYPLILKDNVREMKKWMKKRDKSLETYLNMDQTFAGARTQRKWKAVELYELCIKEIERIRAEMRFLDSKFHWIDNLHQERFKFITNDIMREF